MIYSLNGEVVHTEQQLAVIECAGVGYACRTTDQTLARLRKGERAKLYTYMHFSQDNVELFGFYDSMELSCFRMLLKVSGVGPKAALSILSGMDTNSFALAVASGDHKSITKAKGVGSKTAQKIVLELKDKLSKDISDISVTKPAFLPNNTALSDALSALMVLGFSESESADALSQLDTSLPVEQLVKGALKKLG